MPSNQNLYEHAKHLVSQMSLDEKVSQMQHYSKSIERLGIPAYNWWNEALHGVARAGLATMFPQAIALAATFDDEMIHQVGDIISTEGRAKYNEARKRGDRGLYKGLTFWSPNINIFRDPRWGRGHETFGEDVYLTKKMAEAMIKGIQGNNPHYLKAAACAKHFVAHSGPEKGRHGFDAVVSEEDMNEVYLPAFKHVVQEAQVEAIMGAYNSVNGELCCGSETLIQGLLRDTWGFKGHFVSDCGAISDFHSFHKKTYSADESAALAVKAGCDLNCGHMYQNLLVAMEKGIITEEAIDKCVTRLIEARLKLGTLEGQQTPFDNLGFKDIATDENRAFAVEVAKKSIVLLKNEDKILPLNPVTTKSIGVIGPNANSREALVGNYFGTPKTYVTLFEGIMQEAQQYGIEVNYCEGAHIYRDFMEPCVTGEIDDRMSEALMVAENSDVVVLCVGLNYILEGEEGDANNPYGGADKIDLHLPKSQERLIQKVAEVNPNIILVNVSGSAVDLSVGADKIKGIVQLFYPGAEGGVALAKMLFGEFSPAGRLPITFYNTLEGMPEFRDYSMNGRTYRYMDERNTLYGFGYGLSYAQFEYESAEVIKTSYVNNELIAEVEVTLTNRSDQIADEVIQVYAKHSNYLRENYRLCGFKRITMLDQNTEKVRVSIGITTDLPEGWVLYIGGCQPMDKDLEESIVIKL